MDIIRGSVSSPQVCIFSPACAPCEPLGDDWHVFNEAPTRAFFVVATQARHGRFDRNRHTLYREILQPADVRAMMGRRVGPIVRISTPP
jgi:hypothetical protein